MFTDQELLEQENIIEAILFMMGDSVNVETLATALNTDKEVAHEAAERLYARYINDYSDRGMKIIRVNNKYQMVANNKYFANLILVASRPQKPILTDAILETLSIIAYKQPITKPEIENIRNVKSDFACNKLIEYGLVEEKGRLDAPGRPIILGTTEEFLRRFGIENVSDLPELDALKKAEIEDEVEQELTKTFGEPIHIFNNKNDENETNSNQNDNNNENQDNVNNNDDDNDNQTIDKIINDNDDVNSDNNDDTNSAGEDYSIDNSNEDTNFDNNYENDEINNSDSSINDQDDSEINKFNQEEVKQENIEQINKSTVEIEEEKVETESINYNDNYDDILEQTILDDMEDSNQNKVLYSSYAEQLEEKNSNLERVTKSKLTNEEIGCKKEKIEKFSFIKSIKNYFIMIFKKISQIIKKMKFYLFMTILLSLNVLLKHQQDMICFHLLVSY